MNITEDFFDLLPLNLMKLLSIIYLTASIKFLTGEYYRRFLRPFTIEFNETIVNYIFNSLNKVLDRWILTPLKISSTFYHWIYCDETIVNYIFNSLNKVLDRWILQKISSNLLPLNLMKLLSIIYLTASIKFLTGEYYRRFLRPFTIEFNETIVNYIFNSLNKVLDRWILQKISSTFYHWI